MFCWQLAERRIRDVFVEMILHGPGENASDKQQLLLPDTVCCSSRKIKGEAIFMAKLTG